MSGIRFDLSSLVWLSSVILLNALIPWPQVSLRLKEKTLKIAFILIQAPFLLINMIDMEFIHFTGRRMTTNSFYLIKESQGKFWGMMQSYGIIITFNIFLLIVFCIIIFKLSFSNNHLIIKKIHSFFKFWKFRIPISLFFLILYIIAARGGFQPKPLEMAHAMALNPDPRLTHLSLNSSFTLINSFQKLQLKENHYFKDKNEYTHLLNSNSQGKKIWPWKKKAKNIVLIILESFGKEYTNLDGNNKNSYSPFLDSLLSSSLCFNNSFANGRRSIEALPSILAGLPSLMDEPFLTSNFQTNTIPQIGIDLEKAGISSVFFHGGANGTMFFQEFTKRIGFSQYYGKSEYPKAEQDDDGSWGIWDGPFFNFFGKMLSKMNKPFFATLFSLSSHHPFRVPTEFENLLPQGPIPILKTIAYTDLMMKKFFFDFKNEPWFKETLFIITADHTSKSYRPEYQTPVGSFKVPLMLYFPGAQFNEEMKKIDLDEPVQHIDIFPTLYDVFSIPYSDDGLSRSLLKTGTRKVTTYLNGQQILIKKTDTLILPTEMEPNQNSDEPSLLEWKAHRQHFVDRLINNR